MVKQTKTFKKGNVTKKALSAILAASMVMTSSSFVMAATPTVEEVVGENATSEEGALVVDSEEEAVADDEQVGDPTTAYTVEALDLLGKTSFIEQATEEQTQKKVCDAIKKAEFVQNGQRYFVDDDDNHYVCNSNYNLLIDDESILKQNAQGDTIIDSKLIDITPGTHSIVLKGTGSLVGGEATATYTITEDMIVSVANNAGQNNSIVDGVLQDKYTYTGNPITPTVTEVRVRDASGEAYETINPSQYQVTYGNNTNVTGTEKKDKATITIAFKRDNINFDTTLYFDIVTGQIGGATITGQKTQSVEYNGKKQLPVIDSVKIGDKTLVKDTDYSIELVPSPGSATVDGKGVANVGTYQINIVGKGNYTGTYANWGSFEITKREVSADNMTVVVEDVLYTGNVIDNVSDYITVIDKLTGKPLTKGTDYDIKYVTPNHIDTQAEGWGKDIGSYEVEIIGMADNATNTNYKQAKNPIVVEYNIVNESLSMAAKAATKGIGPLVYSGESQFPEHITVDGETVSRNKTSYKNFDAEFPNLKDCVNAGTYEIKLTGKNKFANQTAVVKFTIVPVDFTNLLQPTVALGKAFEVHYASVDNKMEAPISHVGNPEKPFINLTYDGTQLMEDKDFVVTSVDTTKKIAYVAGKGNFRTTEDVAFAYTTDGKQVNLNDSSIQVKVNKTFSYTGYAIKPTKDDFTLEEVGPSETRKLIYGSDYEFVKDPSGNVMYKDNLEVGTGYVKIKAVSPVNNATTTKDFSGERWLPFEITANEVATVFRLDTTKLKSSISYKDVPAGGYKPTVGPSESLPASRADISIKKVTDSAYATASEVESVKYLRDGKVTTDFKTPGTITVEVTMKSYTGKLTAEYTIVGKELTEAVEIDYNIPDQQYTGKEIKPVIKITEKDTVVGTVKEGRDYTVTYVNNIERGRAYAVVEGIGNYIGKYYVPFNIVGQEDQTITVLAAQARDIQSRTLNSKPTVVKFEAGKAPKTAVTYESSDEDVVKVDETGKITYTGLGEATITIKAAETAEYKAAEATMTVKVGLAKPSFTPFSKNNAFTLTSSTVKGAEKFEVQYATKKDFSNKKSVKFKATSGKVRQVKVSAGDKKTYYVRVRAISGTETSEWSKVKTVATK